MVTYLRQENISLTTFKFTDLSKWVATLYTVSQTCKDIGLCQYSVTSTWFIYKATMHAGLRTKTVLSQTAGNKLSL